jgi:hypothetical protein
MLDPDHGLQFPLTETELSALVYYCTRLQHHGVLYERSMVEMERLDPNRIDVIGMNAWDKLKVSAQNLTEEKYNFITNLPKFTQKPVNEIKPDPQLEESIRNCYSTKVNEVN